MTTQTQSKIDVDTLIAAARTHGEYSESDDHEAGDLQEYMRSAWSLMTHEEQSSAMSHARLRKALKTASGQVFLSSPQAPGGDEVLKKVLKIFKDHGIDEGSHAEIQDLQDALRAVWDVLPPEKRDQMLNMPCVQKNYLNGAFKPLFRYVACAHWGHIFGPSLREDMTRWVFDRHEENLVAAQVEHQSAWLDLGREPFADLTKSLQDNDVSISEEESDFCDDFLYFADVPSWDDLTKAFEAARGQSESQGEAVAVIEPQRERG